MNLKAIKNITFRGILYKLIGIIEDWERKRLFRKFLRKYSQVVCSGPFMGLKYANPPRGANYLPKLIGSYENELHSVIERFIQQGFQMVINVGCAEGYYAVGMATAIPDSHVYAYDNDEEARCLCRKMAELNGVAERLTIRGECNCAELNSLPLDGALVIMDCEGSEVDILRPDLVPGLKSAYILVESHCCFRPGTCRLLYERFSKSHQIEFIASANKRTTPFVCLEGFSDRERTFALDERRLGQQEWTVMRPNAAYGSESGRKTLPVPGAKT